MISSKYYALIIIVSSIGGIIFYGFYDEKIHIDYSIKHSLSSLPAPTMQPLTLFYKKEDTLISLIQTFTPSDNSNESIKNIINIWLSYVYEYDTTLAKTTCTSLTSCNNIHYCSFSNSPFYPTTTVHNKHNFFEGILYTLNNYNADYKSIIFLINHNFFEDSDYDFSLPWEISIIK